MDTERTALYGAEVAAFDGTDLEQQRPFDELHLLAAEVLAGEWWPGPKVELTRARVDARSSSTRCESGNGRNGARIRLAPGQMTVATLAHELAHALAGAGAGHDATFRSAYVDVVAVTTNLASTDRRRDLHVQQLLGAFVDAGLEVGRRRWPPPPTSASGAIAL